RGVRVGQRHAVALAHLAGADTFDGEIGDGSRAEHGAQPFGGQVRGTFDDQVCSVSHAMNLAVGWVTPNGQRAESVKPSQASRRSAYGSYSTRDLRSNTSTAR